jgi:uncharacterized protein YprB with RNaseH-like and TPR domain
MIEQTFLFLPGVQERMERKLWGAGVSSWDHLLEAGAIDGVSRARLSFWKGRVRELRALLDSERRDTALMRLLGARHAWRLYGDVMDEPRFVDIETSERCHDVTVVGVSDGEFYQAFVQGVNLDTHCLRRALAGASCLVTFNGSSFDLPILERVFPGALPAVPHLDVRHICAHAGLRGGLKRIERHLAIRRAGTVRDLDGTDAILLWHRYRMGEHAALAELIDYNAADVLNLKPLLDLVVPALWRSVRFGDELPFVPVPAMLE